MGSTEYCNRFMAGCKGCSTSETLVLKDSSTSTDEDVIVLHWLAARNFTQTAPWYGSCFWHPEPVIQPSGFCIVQEEITYISGPRAVRTNS